MIKTTFINSTQAEYTDKEISWVQDLLLEKGYFQKPDGSRSMEIVPTSPISRSVVVKTGTVLVPYTKNGVTFKVLVENTADVTLASSPTPVAGYFDYVIVKIDTTVEPSATKGNVGSIQLVRLPNNVDADSSIQASIGSNYTFLRLGYVNAGAITDFQAQDIANQSSKVYLTQAISISKNSIVYPDGYFSGGSYPANPYKGQLYWNETTDPKRMDVFDGTIWKALVSQDQFEDGAFGDGSDGSVTISANTTLTEDKHYVNLTINAGVRLNTNGYRLLVKGTLTNNGIISNNGGDGGIATAGVSAGNTLPAGGSGGAGGGYNGYAAIGGGGGAGGGVVLIQAKTIAVEGTIEAKGGNGGNGWGGGGIIYNTFNGSNGGNVTRTLSAGGNGGNGGNGGGTSGVGGTSTQSGASVKDKITLERSFDFALGVALQGGAGGGGGSSYYGSQATAGGGGGGQGGVIIILYRNFGVAGTRNVSGGTGGTGVNAGNGDNGSVGRAIALAI